MKVKNRGMKAALARELGISGAAVSKLAARGMPVDNADAARRWRAAHQQRTRLRPDPGPSDETLVRRASELAALASSALAAHRFDLVADDLRAALRAVPASHRPLVEMDFEVWAALVGAYALTVMDDGGVNGSAVAAADDEPDPGEIAYALACGEAHIA